MTQQRDALIDTIVDGIQDKKGQNIVVLDMRKAESSICDYFVICEGNSSTHVDSIADAVEDKVREQLGEKPLHDEGRRNAIWVLLDYHTAIVHIFQHDAREFYSLETLWNDAARTDIPNIQ